MWRNQKTVKDFKLTSFLHLTNVGGKDLDAHICGGPGG